MFFLACSISYADIQIKEVLFDINGKGCPVKIPAINIDGHLYVPLNNIGEEMDISIEKSKESNTSIIRRNNKTISFTIGQKKADVDSVPFTLKNPPFLMGNDFFVPIRFLVEILEGEINWEVKDTPRVNIILKHYLEKDTPLYDKCSKLMDRYFELLNTSTKQSVSEKKWREVLSEDVLTYKKNNIEKVFYSENNKGKFGISPIFSPFYRFQVIEPHKYQTSLVYTHWGFGEDPLLKSAMYHKTYTLIENNGEIRLTDEQTLDYRYLIEEDSRIYLGIPLRDLTNEELLKINEQWNKVNAYRYEELLDLDFGSILSRMYEYRVLCDFEYVEKEEYYQNLLQHFSDDIQNSQGWKDFLSLNGGNTPPEFKPIIVESRSDYIRMTMYGYLYPDLFESNLAIVDVVIEKIDNKWIFTKIENVKEYQTLYDFRENNRSLYESTIKMISYLKYLYTHKE